MARFLRFEHVSFQYPGMTKALSRSWMRWNLVTGEGLPSFKLEEHKEPRVFNQVYEP